MHTDDNNNSGVHGWLNKAVGVVCAIDTANSRLDTAAADGQATRHQVLCRRHGNLRTVDPLAAGGPSSHTSHIAFQPGRGVQCSADKLTVRPPARATSAHPLKPRTSAN